MVSRSKKIQLVWFLSAHPSFVPQLRRLAEASQFCTFALLCFCAADMQHGKGLTRPRDCLPFPRQFCRRGCSIYQDSRETRILCCGEFLRCRAQINTEPRETNPFLSLFLLSEPCQSVLFPNDDFRFSIKCAIATFHLNSLLKYNV